jgi:hypothetical protein
MVSLIKRILSRNDGFVVFSYFCLVLGIFLLVTAFQQPRIKVPTQVAKEFRPYVYNFLKASQGYNLPEKFNERLENLTIKFGNVKKLKDTFVGYCELITTTVMVDKEAWDRYQEGSRQSLIDHELGHCLLERHHRHAVEITEHQEKLPISIMYPNVLPHNFYKTNKKVLYDELFSPDKYDRLWTVKQIFQNKFSELSKYFSTEEEILMHIDNELNGDRLIAESQKNTEIVFEPMEITVSPKKRVEK